MILLGSRALSLRALMLDAPKLIQRKPVDFDYLCTEQEFNDWLDKHSAKINPTKIYPLSGGKKWVVEGSTNVEFEIIQPGTSSEKLNDLVVQDPDTVETSFGLIPNLDILFTLKQSHRYLKNSPHTFKTLIDWHSMRHHGAAIRPEYETFLKLREKETYADQKHPSLMQTKENFFSGDQVQYVFQHDDLHLSVKHFEKPAYLYYMKDGSEVFSDKNKFFACSEEIRLAGGCEEVTVLALERSQIPFGDKWAPKQSWMFALSKVITSITSGFFRQYCWENAFKIIKMYPENYVEKFRKDVESGLVRYIAV